MPDTRSPAEILTRACNAAHAAGIPIHTDQRSGVIRMDHELPRWQRSPLADACSPLGCVLLAEQPDRGLYDEALCHVFGETMLFHLGLEDAIAGADPSENLMRGANKLSYVAGYRVGVQVRLLLCTERCDGHNVRHPRSEFCPMCAAGVPVPRLRADEVTLPIALPPEV